MGLRVFFSFFFLRKNFHDPGHMVKKHRSEIFLDKHIWYKITQSSVHRDNLVCPQHCGTSMREGVPSQRCWTGHFFCYSTAVWLGNTGGEGGSLFLLLHYLIHCVSSERPCVFPRPASGESCCGDVLTVAAQSSAELALVEKAGLRTNKCLQKAGALPPRLPL